MEEEKVEKTEELSEEQKAENQRLLDAEDEGLSLTEKAQKTTLVNAQEEKELLEADEADLSDEDKEKKSVLVKAKEEKEKEADKEKGKEKDRAPEKYEDFTLPEGAEINQARVDEFKTIAKEFNLSQEKAQRLIDLQAGVDEDNAKRMRDFYENRKEDWREETVKELGADHKDKLVFAERTIAKYATPELKKLLNETGLGNHKELVNFFIKVGKTISEDQFIEGKRGGKPKSDAELFYGNSMK